MSLSSHKPIRSQFFILISGAAFVAALWSAQAPRLAFAKEVAQVESKVKPVETQLARESRRAVLPGESSSVKQSQAVNEKMGVVSSEALLGEDRTLRARGGSEKVKTEKGLTDETRRAAAVLRFGKFRNESLADGAVSAPGLEDFAAFFKKSSDATQSSLSPSRVGEKDEGYMARQAEAERLRSQTIESIQKIMATNPPAEQQLNLYMRLSEIYIESYAYLLELDVQQFGKAYDEWVRTKKGPEPKFSDKRSKARLFAGVESLREASKKYPTHQRAPEILYNLGFLLNLVESDSARIYFEKLVTNYKQSEYVPKAYLALGEFFFQRTKFDEALKNYQAVLNFKGTDPYHYAVYKIGWTYFNLPGKNQDDHKQNLTKSLAAFQLIVKLADASGAPQSLRSLRDEALKDMVLVFVELGDIAGAQKFYASLGENELYFTFLERLAWQSTESGSFDAATNIYRKLITEAKTHKRMPIYLSRLIEVQEKRQELESVLAALKFMSTTLAKDSPWYREHANNKELIEERDQALSKALTYWPKYLHSKAQQTQRSEYYSYALEAYQVHIQNFPQVEESYDSYFYSGEIYVSQKRYEDAAGQYSRAVVLDEKLKLGKKLTREALLNAIASLDLELGKQQAPALPEAGKATTAIPLPATMNKLVWCFDAFIRLYPEDPEAIKLAHRAARFQYAFGDYVDSSKRWVELTKRAPRSPEAGDGIRMTLRVFLNKQDWQGTRQSGDVFMKIPGVSETYAARDIVSVMKVALFQLGMQNEAERNYQAAEEHFVAYQKEYPDDSDASKALFNAANNAFKSGRMDAAVTYLKTLLTQYPNSSLTPDAHYLVATSMDGLGEFDESASSYERLAQGHPDHKLARDASYRAIQLRYARGEHAAVEKSSESFLNRWGTSAEAPEVWSLLGRSAEARSRFQAAVDVYDKAARASSKVSPWWSVFFYARAANAAERAQDLGARKKNLLLGEKTFSSLSDEQRSKPSAVDGVAIIARLKLADVEEQLKSVMSLKISDGLKVTDDFTKIRSSVETVASQYVEIVKLGNAEVGIQCLYRVAELQSFLASTLLNAPVPKGASPAEAEEFRGTLERIGLPLQEEAANLYLTAWQRARETEAITPFTAEIYRKLVELRPAEYRKLEAKMPRSSYQQAKLVLNEQTKVFIGK